jgi:predicted RNase H-like HicB family nuclease/predicted RNA binding protein YcfA (HicA-like mRNA interferase family)
MEGQSDANIAFNDLCGLLEHLGFERKQGKGSHIKFKRKGIQHVINLQPDSSNNAKEYQIKQVRNTLKSKEFIMNEQPKYSITIYWSKADNCYIGEVPELQEGPWFHGSTYEECLQNGLYFIVNWIDTAKEEGWSIPEPKGRLVAVS